MHSRKSNSYFKYLHTDELLEWLQILVLTLTLSNATATFWRIADNGKYYSAEEIHDVNLVSLNKEFAAVIDTVSLLNLLS